MSQKITKLEDIIAWQEARILMQMVYEVTKDFPADEKYNLIKHMRECTRNIPGNIAEGFGRFHYQEAMQFYRIARGSLAELKSDMYCSFDCQYLNKETFQKLIDQNEKVGKLLNGFINSAQEAKRNFNNPNTNN
jgi:four helix bundle protein